VVDKHIEYKAETLKVAGIAMFTPTGRFFFEPIKLFHECGLEMFAIYFFLTVIFYKLGFWCILRGYKLLEKHDAKP